MFAKFWIKITDRGVTPQLDFNLRNKIRVFNSSIFVIGSLYLFYTAISIFLGNYLSASLSFISWAISAFCLYLMSQKKYQLAYHITGSLGLIFLFTFSLLYGEQSMNYIFLLFIPVAAIVLFDDFKICFIYFIATIIALIFIKIYFLKHLPYYPDQDLNKYLGIFNLITTALLLYMAVRMFKQENLTYSKEINLQRTLLEEINKDILASITYAKRLQDAILPPLSLIKKTMPESFVLYKPKDIVAGDFYWMEQIENKILIAAADCTGHGVPGALVSVVCSNALNRTVKEFHISEPGKILDKVRELLLETFEKSENNVQDGMDISLCCIHTKTNEIEWSGANNSLLYFQDNALKEIFCDKQPIGKNDHPTPFRTNKITFQKGDVFYLFTDGFADQFGGKNGKKFKHKQLREVLSANANKPMEEQKNILNTIFENWKGSLEQVDDVLIMGIKME